MNDLNLSAMLNDLQVLGTSPAALLGYSWLSRLPVLVRDRGDRCPRASLANSLGAPQRQRRHRPV